MIMNEKGSRKTEERNDKKEDIKEDEERDKIIRYRVKKQQEVKQVKVKYEGIERNNKGKDKKKDKRTKRIEGWQKEK